MPRVRPQRRGSAKGACIHEPTTDPTRPERKNGALRWRQENDGHAVHPISAMLTLPAAD
jgi:hypothetical protein